MIIHSNWHIHSEYSYDASLTLTEIAQKAKEYGFKKVGITDHVNWNDDKFLSDLQRSAVNVNEFQKTHPEVVLGVELTPIERPEFDYIAKYHIRDGYIPPKSSEPYDIELAQTKEELMAYGVQYAIGASHWRIDSPNANQPPIDINAFIKEWYRQQLWLACDERVTILGHPWYISSGLWYEDFSVIPRSMNEDIAAALKENKKYVECNAGVLCSKKASEKFRRQYAEFLRELFEKGIPVTYGSDSHHAFPDTHLEAEKYLMDAGFKDGDFSEIAEEDLW